MRSRVGGWRPVLAAGMAAVVVANLATQVVVQSAAEAEPARPGVQAALAQPDEALGSNWRTSSDVLVTGVGDTEGYHLFVARERDAFGWSTLATLTSRSLDVGPWTGSVCVTGSGRYAVAVFAPKKAANIPALSRAGALAAVVDIATGKATHVATGVELAHFNPACGPGDRALLTRSLGDDFAESTQLLTVDAAAARVTRTRTVAAQLTTPAPAPDGDYGIAGGRLVRIDEAGRLTEVARPQGQTFTVLPTAGNGIDLVAVDGKQAVAQRFRDGKLTVTATGPWDKLQLFGQRGGSNVLVGQATLADGAKPQLATVPTDRQVHALSLDGHLVAEEVVSRHSVRSVGQPLAPADRADAGEFQVKVRATGTGRDATHTVGNTAAPRLNVDLATGARAGGPQVVGPRTPARAAADDPAPTPTCAVPRNNPYVQPLQPSPDMVEWAVDQAVHGRLNVTRPANYLKAGLPAYRPQDMFPPRRILGGGTVPAQVMLGILAQETNLSQASWHVVPGDTGNPLVASYYGNDGNLDLIDYSKTDCGYGIGQVTDGMRADSSVFSPDEQRAIAVDYAANIAAALNILIEKWNQLAGEASEHQSWMNTNEPGYVENWFLAVWAYNSGYYPWANRNTERQNGRWGVGWFNNPANPRYRANRPPFLRATMADAETPNQWSYPERIMGWMETPQQKGYPLTSPAYAEPAYGPNAPRAGAQGLEKVLTLPDRYAFCSAVNNCSRATNGCPAESELCWWHGPAISGDCRAGECSQENLAFALGSAEPGVKRIYPRNCSDFNGFKDLDRDATRKVSMVYSLNDTRQYNLGCEVEPSDGKFTIRAGLPAGSPDSAPHADINLHQAGAGYKGHIWFTYKDVTNNPKRRIVGSWVPNLDLRPGERARYDIVAHLPSHGADAEEASYIITGAGGAISQCNLNPFWETQMIPNTLGEDKWVYLGAYELGRGSQVQLNNAGGYAGDRDGIAFDAMAFVPIANRTGHKCTDDY